eukprot:COSAG02_NODE_7243_length_3099_cov_7.936667_4_plen_142_part_00
MSTDFAKMELGTSSNLVAAFEAAFAALWDLSNAPQGTLRHNAIVLLSDSSQSVHPTPPLSFSLLCALLMIMLHMTKQQMGSQTKRMCPRISSDSMFHRQYARPHLPLIRFARQRKEPTARSVPVRQWIPAFRVVGTLQTVF